MNGKTPTQSLGASQRTSHFRESNLLGTSFFMVVVDLIGTAILCLSALLMGPLLVLKGPLSAFRLWQYLWVLLPRGLCTGGIRGFIDWRLGNFDSAIAQIEGIIGIVCSNRRVLTRFSAIERRVLEDLFTLLTRAYLHTGHIDEAMQTVIRAGKLLNLTRLSGLADMDCKTAHLVRAGLAAGRLLDGDGVATLFVKSNQPAAAEPAKPRKSSPSDSSSGLNGSGAGINGPGMNGNDAGGSFDPRSIGDSNLSAPAVGKVIPFPFSRLHKPSLNP